MTERSIKTIPESLRYGTICVDSYDDKIPVGRLRYGPQGTEKAFRGLMQLLLLTENALQETNSPGAYMQPRRFRPAAEMPPTDGPHEKFPPGRLATFRLQVLFRQNAGWQGMLCWVDSGQEQAFRSVLELATLLDSALDGGNEPLTRPA